MAYGNYERAIAQAIVDEMLARAAQPISGGSDATASNQQEQLAVEQQIRDRLDTLIALLSSTINDKRFQVVPVATTYNNLDTLFNSVRNTSLVGVI